jgi:streptogramin lyase
LWVSNEGSGHVLEYTKSQLTKSGSPTPKAQFFPANSVEGIAFDSSGDLWVAAGRGASVVEYARSQLTAASPTAMVTLTSASFDPHGIIFDPSGDLWAANYENETVMEFTTAQLLKTGRPASHLTIHFATSGGPIAVAIGP